MLHPIRAGFALLVLAAPALCQAVRVPGARKPDSWELLLPREIASEPDGRRRVRGEVLIGLSSVADLPRAWSAVEALGGTITGEVPRQLLVKVSLPSGVDERVAVRDYAALPGVAYAGLNHVGSGAGDAVPPNDTHYAKQWHHANTGQTGGTVGADIETELAWQAEQGSASVVLAVLDTGIDFAHPEFIGRTLPGFDFVNEDGDPTADHPHGINVTGLAAGNADNSFGIAGVDRNCTILPVKVLDQFNGGTEFDLAQGLDFCGMLGADVVNMSLINYPLTTTVKNALMGARNAGCILMACAGNGGLGDADLSGPGASPLTISIGATDDEDKRAGFSGTGNALDFVAPGSNVSTASTSPTNTFSLFSGCSAATPVASGVVALLKARYPNMDQDCAYAILQAGAEDLVGPGAEDTPGWDPFFGHGRINAGASVTGPPPCADLLALIGTGDFIDLQAGGMQTLAIQAGTGSAGQLYWVLGSATGTSPGVALPSFNLPLNPDGYTQLTSNLANSVLFPNTLGLLSGGGTATAGFSLPPDMGPDPGLAGLVLHHAYFLMDLSTFAITGTSNAVPVTLLLLQSLLETDFESGLAGWTLDNVFGGLWHLAPNGECGAVSQMVAYTRGPATCDYANGLLNLGSLNSPPFLITGTPPYRVEFDSLRTLDATGFDATTVILNDTASAQSATLSAGFAFDNTGTLESVLLTVPNPSTWTGKTVELRFFFAAASGGNDTLGWLVDNVRVTAAGP